MLTTGKLGFGGLTALVFGLMVGVGIYNLPQNMASVASPASVFFAWLITAVGILPLVFAFKWLSDKYPQFNAGIYQYAQAGFGNYAGFNIAWGYWLCSAFSNVAYGVMLNDSFGAFFPELLKHGRMTVIFGSVLIWVMYFIVSRGIKTAKTVNTILAVIKVLMLLFIVVIFSLFFKAELFDLDLFGKLSSLGDLDRQIRDTMMITLFCFFGVEGAVMMSSRAKRSSDVGKAGIAGFVIALVLYMCVSLLCFGLMSRQQLSGLNDPSIAYILRDTCGEWSYWFVICAVIVSLVGGWVAWTLVVAQVPYEAAELNILPKSFKRLNRHGMPAYGLIASSLAMEFFLLLVVTADDVYLTALRITGPMIIPCYLFTGLYLLKIANTTKLKVIATAIIVFCLWATYAGGVIDMLKTSIFYVPGVIFFVKARKENQTSPGKIFTRNEKMFFALLVLCAIISTVI